MRRSIRVSGRPTVTTLRADTAQECSPVIRRRSKSSLRPRAGRQEQKRHERRRRDGLTNFSCPVFGFVSHYVRAHFFFGLAAPFGAGVAEVFCHLKSERRIGKR